MALTKIKTSGIADNAITNAKMADDAIDSADFADASIDNVHVATGLDAVKLADGTVTNAEFQYINTLSSNAQTQISAKSPTAGNASLVTTGALASGSIASGFGTIDTGSSTIATTGAVSTGALTVGGNIDFNSGTLDLGTQTVDVTLADSVDALNFDSNTLSIDALNERVGIGIAAPSAPLEVYDTSGAGVKVSSAAGDWRLVTNNSTGAFELTESGVAIQMKVLEGGNVGIGNANAGSPEAPLHVKCSGAGAGIRIEGSFGNYGKWDLAVEADDADRFGISGNNTEIMSFKNNGSVGIGTVAPASLLHIYGGSSGSGTLDTLTLQHSNTTTTNDGPNISFEGYYLGAAWQFGRIKTYNNAVGYGASMDFDVHPADGTQGSNVVTAMTIRGDGGSAGRVGIGTTAPDVLFHLKGGSANDSVGAPALKFQKVSGGAVDSGQRIGSVQFWVNDDGVNSGSTYERAAIVVDSQNTSSGAQMQFWTGNSNLAVAKRMTIMADGYVGINNTSPANQFSVHTGVSGYVAEFRNTTSGTPYKGITIQCGYTGANFVNTAVQINDGDGDEQGTITFTGGTVAYNTFIAGHFVELPSSDNDDGYDYGTLVETTEIFYTQVNNADSERGILYKVQKSSSEYSKGVLGVYSGKFDDKDNLHQVYVLGDGHILCNGEKGNILVGDGICTSSTNGEGMKADKMAMIIGIAQEDVSFSGSESKLVAVQYGLQQFTPWENA